MEYREKYEEWLSNPYFDEATKEELRAIIAEQGKISVHCHYCNTDYDFTAEDAENIIAHARQKE